MTDLLSEDEKKVYEFIQVQPRSRKEIISYVKSIMDHCHVTADNMLKTLIKNGYLEFQKVDREYVYSISNDPRLHFLAEKIAMYDVHSHRISKLASHWGKYNVEDFIETSEEVSARVKSFTKDDWYPVMLRNNGEYYCSCSGFTFYQLPCVHILALAVYANKIEWI